MATFGLFSSPSTRPLPSDPITRADVQHVLQHGYIILENVFTLEKASSTKAEIRRLHGDSPAPGRNPFEGLDTNRIYSLLNKSREFDDYTIFPRVLALNDYFLDPGYQITAFHTIQINPGEKPQGLHHDDGFIQLPRPRPPMGSAILVALDDFTPSNGATRIIPGSHEWDSQRHPEERETVPAVCPAGSVVYFISTLWHGGGGNRSERPRMSLTVQYCQPYIRQIENQVLAVDPRRLEHIPERIVAMMGYRTHNPFIGYADGLNPVTASQRMVAWLQKPLDPSPPTYARHVHAKL